MTGSSDIKIGLRAAIATSVLAVALALPAQAGAQGDCASDVADPTAAQYCSPSAIRAGNSDTPKHEAPNRGASSETLASNGDDDGTPLPFTGFDVIALLAVAGALAGFGLALRRLTASEGRKN